MKQLTVAIAGLGSRGLDTYAQCAKRFPEKMAIAAVADWRPERVAMAVEQFGLKPEQCFASVEEMLEKDQLADILFAHLEILGKNHSATRLLNKNLQFL